MADTNAVLTALKRALKARGKTYRDVAEALELSEASVKRLFSQRDFTLERLDRVCAMMELSLGDLVRLAETDLPAVAELTEAQERGLVADRKLLAVAVLAVNGWRFEEILEYYRLTEPELIGCLARLDRLKLIELLPRNRIRLRISREFTWRKHGPIERLFTREVRNEFLRSHFDKPGESLRFVSGMLSDRSAAVIQRRLEQVAHDFNELHQEDMKLPLAERHGSSLLLAIRSWEPGAMSELRREPAGPGRAKG